MAARGYSAGSLPDGSEPLSRGSIRPAPVDTQDPGLRMGRHPAGWCRDLGSNPQSLGKQLLAHAGTRDARPGMARSDLIRRLPVALAHVRRAWGAPSFGRGCGSVWGDSARLGADLRRGWPIVLLGRAPVARI